MKLLLSILVLFSFATNAVAKYPSSESCNECHENIYREHTNTMHHKSTIFSDEVHRKMKNTVNPDKYKCAICHMPATRNLRAVMNGDEQPDPDNHRQSDGVSCFFCHQISKIYNSKAHQINFSNYKNEKKPTVFGNLKKPYESNEHETESNEIYKNSEVCMGCHSHKQNKLEFEVCNTKNEYDKTSDCIGCHMPKTPGTIEKEDKGIRDEYASHEFLGVHSKEMIKKAVKLELSYKDDTIELTITNKMGHSIITHPMRLKFAKTVVKRDSKVIWSNFKENPMEDKDATFAIVFKDSEEKPTLPHKAVGYKINRNLKAAQSKTVKYKVEGLKKGDEITTTWISYIVKPSAANKLQLTDKEVTKPYKGIEESVYVY